MSALFASTTRAANRRASIGAALVALVALLSTVLAAPAFAADGDEFDPGYIISDDLMYTDSAMSEEQIQSFLTTKASANDCTSSNCLHKLTVDSKDKPASTTCAAYTGVAGESVARIIYRIQQLCTVSAKVLLVTLEKEQGLISSGGPTSTQLKVAMGYGCPDTAACNSLYYGIDNQIYWAARAFGWYRSNPYDRHEVGTMNVYYHPNSNPAIKNPPTCGTKKVTIRNEATAALYNYTPYTPNQASLDNMYTTGDKCSSYGNRNFWAYYTDWFGSPIGKLSSSVTKSRVYGDDRYETSVAVSKSAFPEPEAVTTVFVASGENYPDGLSAAPAAAAAGGPLLLTEKSSLPAAVKAEIQRLAPEQIVVVGGTPTISSSVQKALAAIAPVTRIAGDDRYETSRMIAAYAFPEGADEVFIAIGSNFPDALAASGAAGSRGIPVILVPKGAKTADSSTRALIARLGATKTVAAGDTKAITSSYLTSTQDGTSVTRLVRLGGATRYQTAAVINEWAYSQATTAYLVSGVKYPDALSAAAVAGARSAPLHLSPGDCLPAASVGHITYASVSELIFVGSSATLTSTAYNYTPC